MGKRIVEQFSAVVIIVFIINIYKTLTSVPSRGREGAWRKNKQGGAA